MEEGGGDGGGGEEIGVLLDIVFYPQNNSNTIFPSVYYSVCDAVQQQGHTFMLV